MQCQPWYLLRNDHKCHSALSDEQTCPCKQAQARTHFASHAAAPFTQHFAALFHQMSYGWRIPFLCGIVVAGIGHVVKHKVEDAPQFRAVATAVRVPALFSVSAWLAACSLLLSAPPPLLDGEQQQASNPVREALATNKAGILAIIGVSLAW